MGGPNATDTGCRAPGSNDRQLNPRLRGQISKAPRNATGTIGTLRYRDRIGAPFLNFLTVPSIDRSPSGKSISTLPMRQAERAGLHRGHQVGVGIDRHEVADLREPPGERRLEILRRADEEQLL